jgi:hypothetical protein
MLLALMISISACSDTSLVPNNSKSSVPNIKAQSRKQQISKIDGQAILKVNTADLYTTNLFNEVRHKLATQYGHVILQALKKKSSKLKPSKFKRHQTPLVAVRDLKKFAPHVFKSTKCK